MISPSRILATIGLIAASTIATTVMASDKEVTADKEITFEQALAMAKISLPKAVEIATKRVKNGKVYRAELVINDQDRTEYEVLLLANGQHIVVDVDGISGKATVQIMDEETLNRGTTFDDLPPAVQDTILSHADAGQVEALGVMYVAKVIEDGDEVMLLIAEDGTLLGESDLEDDEYDDDPLAALNEPMDLDPGVSAHESVCEWTD